MSAIVPNRIVDALVTPPPVCRSVSRSHVGRVRAVNEDRVFDDPAVGVWVVADGMGGHSGGDVAAQQIVASVRNAVAPTASVQALHAALQEANAAIHARNLRLGLEAGATAVAAVLTGHSLQIAWAGDSRAYRFDEAGVELLTHDHSVVQQLLDAGLIDAETAKWHPHANVVTRAFGIDPDIVLDTVTSDFRGSRLLLCSDGLSRSLQNSDLRLDVPLERLADNLLARALERDGSDNVSLILLELN